MTDEKFVFVSDVRDKKRTARGAHNRRTHAGKGGRVKMPSDFMTKKEREAMNGEVKSYKLNAPMNWNEFKAMPDDLQVAYLQTLRKRYAVGQKALGEMFGVSDKTVSLRMKELGIAPGRGGTYKFDADGWTKFIHGVKLDPAPAIEIKAIDLSYLDEADEHELEEARAEYEDLCEANKDDSSIPVAPAPIVPSAGVLTFEGRADESLQTLIALLRDANVTLNVSWERV